MNSKKCRSGEIGRRAGLKIQSGLNPVPVRVRPSVLLYNFPKFILFTVYAIKSLSHKFIYVGLTNNLDRRINDHNSGYNQSTKHYKPFELIYSESFSDRISARKREKELKSGSGKKFLYSLISDS